jgi:hypothetical protein
MGFYPKRIGLNRREPDFPCPQAVQGLYSILGQRLTFFQAQINTTLAFKNYPISELQSGSISDIINFTKAQGVTHKYNKERIYQLFEFAWQSPSPLILIQGK